MEQRRPFPFFPFFFGGATKSSEAKKKASHPFENKNTKETRPAAVPKPPAVPAAVPAAAAPAQQPLAELAPAPAPSAMESPIEATGGKSVVYASPLVPVSGAPLLAAPAPLLAFPKKTVEWETIEIKKPKVKRVAATPVSGAAPVAPLLVQLPRKALPNQVVPTFLKPGTAVQPVLARKTLLPAKVVELPEVGMWIPAQVAPTPISGAPISGAPAEGIPIFKKKVFG